MNKAAEHSFRLQRYDQLSRMVQFVGEDECRELIRELVAFELNLIHENANLTQTDPFETDGKTE